MEIGSGIIIFTKIIPLLKGNGFPSMTIERILFMKQALRSVSILFFFVFSEIKKRNSQMRAL